MIYKTHLALNALLLQSILYLSNISTQNILNPWGLGIITGTTFGSFLPDIDAPQSEISKRFLPAKTILIIIIPIISIILSFSLFNHLNSILIFKSFQSKSIFFMFIFSTTSILLTLLFNKILKPLLIHRGLFHSIFGLLFINLILASLYTLNTKQFSLNFINMYKGIYIGINIGYIGHIIGDLFTYHGIRPFFPHSFKISLKILKTNSLEERVLFYILIFANIIFLLKNIFQ